MKKVISIFLLIAFIFSQNLVFAVDAFSDKHQDENEPISNSRIDVNLAPNLVQKSATISTLSPIEKIFNDKEMDETNKVLHQRGYDVFGSPFSSQAGANGKYSSNYKLSIGEKVNIYLYGDSVDVMAISGSSLLTPLVKTVVDSNGSIFVNGLGLVQAEGKTISEIEQSLNRVASTKYKNLKVKLSISAGQEMSIFVYGQVNTPGKVFVGNNSSLIDALSAAGGVKKTGTLRTIMYTSGKKNYKIDLYRAIFEGVDYDIIVKPNDKIFVPSIGEVVAVKNGVKEPGIYEIKENENFNNIINYAGGLLPGTQTKEVVLTSLDTKTLERSARNMNYTAAKNSKLKSGDTIEFKELYNTAENTVVLQGNVKHPATYAYKPGMRLSDILPDEKELLEETFITQAVIRRVSGDDNRVETISVFLKEFFDGSNDPLLQPKDVISIYKNTNTPYVDVYGCVSIPKHIPYVDGMNLSDILAEIQFVDSSFTEDENEKNVSLRTEENDKVLVGGTENNNKVIPAENVAVEIIGQDSSVQLYYLYDIMVNSFRVNSIALKPQDKVFFRQLRDNEKVKSVKVAGYVKNPATFKFVKGCTLKDMIEQAGGLADDADLRGVVYLRKTIPEQQIDIAKKNQDRDIQMIEGNLASGMKQSSNDIESKQNMLAALRAEKNELAGRYNGRIVLNIKSNDLDKITKIDNIEVQDGDTIYVPRFSKHVSVIGEVYNEQSFIYRKGYTYRKYKKEVGGYTPNAAKFRVYKVAINGQASRVHTFTKIEQGDTVVVPRKIAGNDWWTPIASAIQSAASIFSLVYMIVKLK